MDDRIVPEHPLKIFRKLVALTSTNKLVYKKKGIICGISYDFYKLWNQEYATKFKDVFKGFVSKNGLRKSIISFKKLKIYFGKDKSGMKEKAKGINSEYLKDKYGQVMTPGPLVHEILDKLPKEVWENPNYKWLDPACGSGNFLVVAFNNLFIGLEKHIQNDNDRRQHILENMLYGLDIRQLNCIFTASKLNPDSKYKLNIECEDSLEYDFRFNGKVPDSKFDVILSNPPYQDSTKKDNNNLWPRFLKLAFDRTHEKGYVAMITPNSWATNLKKLYIPYFLHKNPLFINIDECAKYFPRIGSTFSYYIIQNCPKQSSDICKVITIDNKYLGPLPELGLGVTSDIPINIMRKLTHNREKFKMITSSGYHTWKIKNDDKTVSKEKTSIHKYQILQKTLKNGGNIYFYSSLLDKNLIGVPRVVINRWAANYNKMIVSNDVLTTENYSHFPVNSIQEAYKLRDLLLTKIYKFIPISLISGGAFSSESMIHFPKIDLHKSWTNENLYKHFGLTEEEIKLIEETVK